MNMLPLLECKHSPCEHLVLLVNMESTMALDIQGLPNPLTLIDMFHCPFSSHRACIQPVSHNQCGCDMLNLEGSQCFKSIANWQKELSSIIEQWKQSTKNYGLYGKFLLALLLLSPFLLFYIKKGHSMRVSQGSFAAICWSGPSIHWANFIDVWFKKLNYRWAWKISTVPSENRLLSCME